jgi:hypothetical protein
MFVSSTGRAAMDDLTAIFEEQQHTHASTW